MNGLPVNRLPVMRPSPGLTGRPFILPIVRVQSCPAQNSSYPGGTDIYAADQGTATAGTVYGLPMDGRTIWVRLWSLIPSTGWQYHDYMYQSF